MTSLRVTNTDLSQRRVGRIAGLTSTRRRRRKSRAGLPKARPGRRDVQGLRALAVALVILNHLTGWPVGGFIGVDVFFVISGFMITGLLLREHQSTGRVGFAAFYRRRLRRLFPAAALTLTVTVALTFVLVGGARAARVAVDAVFALLLAANWRMSATGTDYFQTTAPPSPLQHFWSLAVEEQFYLIWPALITSLLSVAARLRPGSTSRWVSLAGGVSLVLVASLACALAQTASNPTAAYFSTFTRAWELAVGAVVALLSEQLSKLPGPVRPVLAWLGLAGIVASSLLVTADGGFPAPAALAPVLATALVIAANVGGGQVAIPVLTNRVAGYLGNISYSLYLWHFPVIILSAVVIDTSALPTRLAVLALTLIISMYSYHLLEDPIRRSRWLEREGPGKKKPLRAPSTAYRLLGCSLLLLVTLSLCVASLWPARPSVSSSGFRPTATTSTKQAAPQYGEETGKLQAEIATALSRTTWPKLDPSIDAVLSSETPPDLSYCGSVGDPESSKCTWGSDQATKTMMIVGDSNAVAWTPALRAIVESGTKWRVIAKGAFGCSFTERDVPGKEASINRECPTRKDATVAAIKQVQPDVVVITNSFLAHGMLTDVQWRDSMDAMVKRFSTATKKVVFLSSPPSYAELSECHTNFSKPADCVSGVASKWYANASVERAVAKKAGGAFVDTRPLFCSPEDWCPSFVGATVTKRDQSHVSYEYAIEVAPALAELLRAAGVIGKV